MKTNHDEVILVPSHPFVRVEMHFGVMAAHQANVICIFGVIEHITVQENHTSPRLRRRASDCDQSSE
jgi:hypothetical protein